MYLNLHEQLGSSNLIGRKLKEGVTSLFIQQDKGLINIIHSNKNYQFIYSCVVEDLSN